MSWFKKTPGAGKGAAAAGAGRSSNVVIGAQIFIDSKEYFPAELGVRSFRIYPYEGELIERQHFSFTFVLTLDKEEVRFPGYGVVRQLTPDKGLSAQFTPPQPFFDQKLIEFVARHRVRSGGGLK